MEITPRLVQVERRAAEVRAPGEPFEGVKRLAVVRLDRLGDVVLTLPAVSALRRAYPRARIAFMVRPPLAALAQLVAEVDEVSTAEPRVSALRRALMALEPDLVVCISREGALAAATVAARVPQRVGTGRRLWSALFTRRVEEPRRAGERHELEYSLSFAHRCGAAAGPAEFGLRWLDEDEREASAWLARAGLEAPFVLLHPGSGGSCPAWPLQHYSRLAELLAAEGWRSAFSVGPQDGAVATALDAMPAAVRSLPRLETTLPVWAAVARRARAVIGNSTGPVHLAAAVGTPTIGFYPSWASCAPARWGPYAANGWAVVADHPAARSWSHRARRVNGQALLAGLHPASVMGLLGRVLEQSMRPGH